MAVPNLFDFATSELSQDAFLCWLLSSADDQVAEPLRRVGRAFIAWLWSAARSQRVDPEDVRLVGAPRRQVDHVDVLFEAEVAGRRAVFVIEDKADTSQHSGQLQRYAESIHRDAVETVLVYFKTGYHFGLDKEAAKQGYAVLGLQEWVAFLDANDVAHDVFRDYREHARRQLKERQEAIAGLGAPGGHTRLALDYVQHEFVEQLASRCAESIGGVALNRGMNMSGTPWTHLRFATFRDVLPGGITEVLFHRVDARNDDNGIRRFYLCTRQYAVVKGVSDAREAKLRRLQEHRAAFARAADASGCALGLSHPASDRQGANESEVGILFFDTEKNSVQAVLDRFPLLHGAFVTAIRERNAREERHGGSAE